LGSGIADAPASGALLPVNIERARNAVVIATISAPTSRAIFLGSMTNNAFRIAGELPDAAIFS
jgi:hypothetical protein